MALLLMSEEVSKPATTCERCNKPKKQTSGSLTQWVFDEGYCVCGREVIETECESLEQSDKYKVEFCSTCGKRSNSGRAGSLTQWIFRQELCTCGSEYKNSIQARAIGPGTGQLDLSGSRHQPVDPSRMGTISDPPLMKEPDAEEELIELSERDFPAARYKPLRTLGQGAIGSVYKCYDRQLKRLVAVKVLQVLNAEELVYFQNEARTSAQLNRPGIIRTLDFGIMAGGHPYMVMDFLKGMPLNTYLQEVGAMSLEDTRYLASRIVDALAYAHKHGIYHRDVKPGNIMVVSTIDGLLKDVTLIDFGLAMFRKTEHNTESGDVEQQRLTLAGTPLYMSADQAQGKTYDARSEVYSVGCILYEMLVGKPPFEAPSLLQLLNKHASEQPPAISSIRSDLLPGAALEQLVNKCLAKSPDDRFQSMDELAEAISEIEPMASLNSDGRVELERVIEEQKTDLRTSKSSRLLVLIIIAAIGIVVVIAAQLNRLKDSPNLSKNFKKSYYSSSIKSMDKMVDFVETLRDQKYVKGADVFTLEGSTLTLKYSKASDAFIQTIKLPADYIRQIVLVDGPVTGKGLSILCEGNSLALMHLQVLPNLKEADVSAAFKKNPKLTDVNLTSLNLQPSIMNSFADLREIEKIYCKYITLTGANLAPLANLPKLRSLTLRYCKVGNHEIEQICSIKSLTYIDITGAHIDDKALFKLSKLPKLKAIYAASCKKVTPEGVKAFIKAAPSCRIEYAIPYVTPQREEYFYDDHDLLKAAASGTDSINVCDWNISNEGIACLVGKPIKYLTVSCTKLTDKAFARISKIQTLESLEASVMDRLSDAALEEVAKLKNLKRLAVNGDSFSDGALARLCENLLLLKEFQANSTKASSKTCQALASKKREFDLISLENCNLQDADIALLAKIPVLKVLYINGNPEISRKGFTALAHCRGLNKLQISTPADEETRRFLKERLPNCNINLMTYSEPSRTKAKESAEEDKSLSR